MSLSVVTESSSNASIGLNDELVNLQNSLRSANELIVLLEKQRAIYRSLSWGKDVEVVEPQLQSQLISLDKQIEQTYKNSDLKRCLQQAGSSLGQTGPSHWAANLGSHRVNLSTPLLGINMKSLITDGQPSTGQDSGSSIGGRSTKWKNQNKTFYKCFQKKCRFSCFSERSLMRHQIQHRHDQLVAILEPHGFELASSSSSASLEQDVQIVVKKNSDGNRILAPNSLASCFFPVCSHQFDCTADDQNYLDQVTGHLNRHLPLYLIYPCFGCMQMFDSRSKLSQHFRQSSGRCREQSDSLFDFLIHNEPGHDSDQDDILGGDPAGVSRCELCPNRYPTRKLLSLHYRLFHQMNKDLSQDEENMEIGPNTLGPLTLIDSFRCKLCRENFASQKLIEIHALMFHNIEDYREICSREAEDQEIGEEMEEVNMTPMLTTTIEQSFDEAQDDPADLFADTMKSDQVEALVGSDDLGHCTQSFVNEQVEEEEAEDSYAIVRDEDNAGDMLMINPGTDLTNGPIHEVVIETTDNNNFSPTESNSHCPMQLESKQASETLTKVISVMNEGKDSDQIEYRILFENLDSCQNSAAESSSTAVEQCAKSGDYVVIDANSMTEYLVDSGQLTMAIGQSDDIKDQQQLVAVDQLDSGTEQPAKLQASLQVQPVEAGGLSQLMNSYIYECSQCAYSFRSEAELSLHNYVLHQLASFSCSHCEFVTQDIEMFRRHETIHRISTDGTTGTANLCTQCQECFDSPHQLSQHLKNRHTTYQCPFCRINSNNRYTLNSHMLSFHRDSIFKCATCSYKTFYEESLRKHERMHATYAHCPYPNCPDSFGSDSLLQSHINKFHKQEKPFQCQFCDQSFYGVRHLNRHLSQQHATSHFRCDICSLECPTVRALNVHRRCHTSDRPFSCTEPGCSSTFRTVQLLKSHQANRHSSAGQLLACDFDQCGRSFKTKTQLRQHYKRHTGNRFVCDFADCGERFASQTQLSTHRLQLAHLKTLFRCPDTGLCGQVFAKKSELNRHLQECKHRTNTESGSLLQTGPSISSPGTTIILNSSGTGGGNHLIQTTNRSLANSNNRSLILFDHSHSKSLIQASSIISGEGSEACLVPSHEVGHSVGQVDDDDGQSLINNDIASIVEV